MGDGTLSGIRELDYEIMALVGVMEVGRLASVSRALCALIDDSFWRFKMRRDYGCCVERDNVVVYRALVSAASYVSYAEAVCRYGLVSLARRYVTERHDEAEHRTDVLFGLAAYVDAYEIMDFLIDEYGVGDDKAVITRVIAMAASQNKLAILEYVVRRTTCARAIIKLTGHGSLHAWFAQCDATTIEYLASHGLDPCALLYRASATRPSLSLVQWIIETHEPPLAPHWQGLFILSLKIDYTPLLSLLLSMTPLLRLYRHYCYSVIGARGNSAGRALVVSALNALR